MNNKNLTDFDKFMIAKNKSVDTAEERIVTEKKVESRVNDIPKSYGEYIENQLRRTGPSAERIMTLEEFESQNETEKTVSRRFMSGNIQFKKFGKILLCAYVIIMLCLALIVIVKTTTNNSATADASNKINTQQAEVKIQTMDEEEDDQSEDWFDKICDSLN